MDLVTSIESWLRTHSARCERHLLKLTYLCPGCQHGMCTVWNDTESPTQCPRCTEPIPQIPNGHQHSESNSSLRTQCLNLHALGEQWIERTWTSCEQPRRSTSRVNTSNSKPTSGAGRQGLGRGGVRTCWQKPKHNLRKALLNAPWKDILLVPQAWYPDHTP